MGKLFSRVGAAAEHTNRWGTFYVIVMGVFTALNKNIPWFGEISWAGAVFVAIWMALLAVFVFAASLALFRYFKPLGGAGEAPPEVSAPSYDDAELRHTMDVIGQLTQTLEQGLERERQRTDVLIAAERARGELPCVLSMIERGRAISVFDPVPLYPDRIGPITTYDAQGQFSQGVQRYAERLRDDEYQRILGERAAHRSPLDDVADEHERPIYGTNAGKARYMQTKTRVDGNLAYLEHRKGVLERMLTDAQNLGK